MMHSEVEPNVKHDPGLREVTLPQRLCAQATEPAYGRRGRFLHYPEEKPGQTLFPSRGYSFLCR